MDLNSILSRTEMGEREIKTSENMLALDLHDLLEAVDGKSTAKELMGRLSLSSESFDEALDCLCKNGFIAPVREFEETSKTPSSETSPAEESNKFAQSKRTMIATVWFLDIVGYTKQSVERQLQLKEQFNLLVSSLIRHVAVEDRVILDTGDGAALGFLGDPEDVLFIAIKFRDALLNHAHRDFPDLHVRMGINLGPVRLVTDMNGRSNLIGDGVNDAQRVMSFAKGDQILVSRSFHDVVSRLSHEHPKLFIYQGVHKDKHKREHEIYEIAGPEEPAPTEAVKSEEEIQAEKLARLQTKLKEAAKTEEAVRPDEAPRKMPKIEAPKPAESAVAKALTKKPPPKPRNYVRIFMVALLTLLLFLLGALPFVSLSFFDRSVENYLSAALREPVSVESIGVSVLPSPRFKLKNVSAGSFKVESLAAMPIWGSFFGNRLLMDRVELNNVSLDQAALQRFGDWKDSLPVSSLEITNVTLSVANQSLPVFNAVVDMTLKHAVISDDKMRIELQAGGDNIEMDLSAKNWTLPFGPKFSWEDLHAKGKADSNSMTGEFSGSAHGGLLKGAYRISWLRNWMTEGTFEGHGLDLATLTSAASLRGQMDIRGAYASEAGKLEQLFDSSRIKAAFTVRQGEIGGVDLAQTLQSAGSQGGVTKFGELSGMADYFSGQYQLRQLSLSSGILNAAGSLDVSAQKKLSGRVNVNLGTQGASFAVSGAVSEPIVRR